MRLSTDERLLMTADQKAAIRLWDTATGELVREWQAFAPDFGPDDARGQPWEMANVNDACFSADGSRIAAVGYACAGGWDKVGKHLLALFDVDGRKHSQHDLTAEIERLTAVEFLPDGRLLIAGCNDAGGLMGYGR